MEKLIITNEFTGETITFETELPLTLRFGYQEGNKVITEKHISIGALEGAIRDTFKYRVEI